MENLINRALEAKKKLFIFLAAALMTVSVMAEKNDLSAKVFQKEYMDVKIVFTNHSDKTIESAEIRLFYYDEQGTQFHYQDENVSINVEPGLSITKEIYIDNVARRGSKNVTVQVRSYTFLKNECDAVGRTRQAEAIAIAKAHQMGSLHGEGKGSGGNSWSLPGREIKGSLPKASNNFRQEGKVVVEIRVNAAGQVISATVKGGDVSDKQTQQLALEAARKAKFTEGDHDQIGTITYIFKLN